MTEPQQQQTQQTIRLAAQRSVTQQQAESMEMPILAYNGQDQAANMLQGEQNVNDSSQVLGTYNIQVRDNPPSKLSNNVSEFRNEVSSINSQQPLNANAGFGENRNGAASSQHEQQANRVGSTTPKARTGAAERIFDARQNAGTLPAHANSTSQPQAANEILVGQNGSTQPVQNVFQFNVRVNNNNMSSGGIVVSSDGHSNNHLQDHSSARQRSLNNKQQHPQAAYSQGAGKGRSKERRPMSSKNPQQQNWQNQSYGHQPASQNPYLISTTSGGRKITKKRPQSANRKNTIIKSLVKSGNNNSQFNHAASFKSPTTTMKGSKYSVTGIAQPNSLPSQKQVLALYQAQQNQYGPPLLSSDLVSSDPTTGLPNAPVIAASNFIQHHGRSLKMSSVQGAMSATSKTFSASKVGKNQNHPTSIFGSPDKAARHVKSKIPSVTLQSREDLYELNMQTKMQINSLRNENRKVNTKLLVLENQLAQKDKLFEDMYKAAFHQVRLPLNNAAFGNNPSMQPQHHQLQHTPAQTANMFHPSGQQHATAGSAQFHGSFNQHHKQQTYVVANTSNTAQSTSTQQHAQAQQLINSYKRTIREQSREIEKRDVEVEKIKRSVKMTQINQVLVENETYRQECLRLREQLEQTMMLQKQTESLQILQQQRSNSIQQQQNQQQQQFLQQQQNSIMQNSLEQNRQESASPEESFKRDLNSPQFNELVGQQTAEKDQALREVRNSNDQLQSKIQELRDKLREAEMAKTKESLKNSQLSEKLNDAQKQKERVMVEGQTKLELAKKTNQKKIGDLEEQHRQLSAEFETTLQACKEELKAKTLQLESQIEQHVQEKDQIKMQTTLEEQQTLEENEEILTLEHQLASKDQEHKELLKQMETLINQNQKGVSDLRRLEEQSEILIHKIKKQELKLKQQEDVITKTSKMAQERAQMHIESQDQNELVQGKLKKKDEYILELEQEVRFKENDKDAMKYEHSKLIAELKQKIELLEVDAKIAVNRAQAFANPPIGPSQNDRRRSTTNQAKKPTSRKSDFGESSFDRASESQVATTNKQLQEGDDDDGRDQDYSEDDRSDLGFSSQGDAEPVLQNSDNNSKQEDKKSFKILLNDKTFLGSDGVALLSPKDLTADSPNVKEGYIRLRYACQVNFIRHDSIENFLFGNDYAPEKKVTIRQVKEAAIAKLKMTESAALDWARYLIEQGNQSISNDGPVGEMIQVDQERTILGMRVVMFITAAICNELVYFRAEKEEKMKLIIGEKLQEKSNRDKILNILQRHKSDKLTFEAYKSIFEQSGLMFNKETLQCCFIYLLKSSKNNDLYEINKGDWANFIRTSAGKAHDFTMTGSKFPLETELQYSSDSDDYEDDMPKDFDNEQASASMKSVKEAKTAGLQEEQSSSSNLAFHQQKSEQQAQKKNQGMAVEKVVENDVESSEDDEFGANESRSSCSGQIHEEIASEIQPSARESNQHLAVNSQPYSPNNFIEDSINDRDLDSSVARIGIQAPLMQVPEVEEQKETTTFEKEEPPKDALVQLATQLQRSRTAEKDSVDEMVLEQNSHKFKTQQTTPIENLTPKSSGTGTGGGAQRKRPKISIDTNSLVSGRKVPMSGDVETFQKSLQSKKSNGSFNNSVGNGQMPQLIFDATENPTGNPTRQEGNDPFFNQSNNLLQLKPENPVPFGITVVQEEHSVFKAYSSDEEADKEKVKGAVDDQKDDLLDESEVYSEVEDQEELVVVKTEQKPLQQKDQIEVVINSAEEEKVPLSDEVVKDYVEKPKQAAVAAVPILSLQQTDELLKTFKQPKNTETNSVVVEELQSDRTSVDYNDDDEPELPKSEDRVVGQKTADLPVEEQKEQQIPAQIKVATYIPGKVLSTEVEASAAAVTPLQSLEKQNVPQQQLQQQPQSIDVDADAEIMSEYSI